MGRPHYPRTLGIISLETIESHGRDRVVRRRRHRPSLQPAASVGDPTIRFSTRHSLVSTTREASRGNPHGNPTGRTKTTTKTASAKTKPKSPSTIHSSCTRTPAAGEPHIRRGAPEENTSPSTIRNGNYGGNGTKKKDESLGARIPAEEAQ